MGLLLAVVVVLAVLAVGAQLLVPWLGGRQIARRLTERGGEATVTLRALPALRLLQRRGSLIRVRGRRLEIGMSRESGGLAALDGFDVVDIALAELTTGPFAVRSFTLSRRGAGTYLMRADAVTSGAALAGFGTAQLRPLATPLVGLLAGGTPLGSRPIAVSVEVELASEAGTLRVVSGGGSVAGYPAGRIAGMIAAAVARRLELSF